MKKLKFWLQLWDGVWSIPLSFIGFVLFGFAGQYFFGNGFGFYDPAFWQAAIMAAGELVFFNLVVFLSIFFNFRHVWKYYLGKKQADGTVHNQSKEDFDSLKPWQRIAILLFLYCFFILVLVSLYTIHV